MVLNAHLAFIRMRNFDAVKMVKISHPRALVAQSRAE